MTIQITVKNTNGGPYPKKAVVSTIDTPSEGDPVVTVIAELDGGEEIATGIHSTRSIEIKEV